MAEEEPQGFWPDWLTPRRWSDFARNIINIEANVARLQIDNRELRQQVIELQNQMTELRAQNALLVDFVRTSIAKR